MRNKVRAAVVAAVLGAGIVAVPAPASASARSGCGAPSVCFYRNGQMSHPSGRFRDVTNYYQWFTRSRGSRTVRNDSSHAAHLLTASGRRICVAPHSSGGVMSGGFAAVKIHGRHC